MDSSTASEFKSNLVGQAIRYSFQILWCVKHLRKVTFFVGEKKKIGPVLKKLNRSPFPKDVFQNLLIPATPITL